jgi:hypothetical protein
MMNDNEKSETEEEGKLVEEFPKPPSYFRSFSAGSLPPSIPQGIDPYEVMYGGSFIATKLRPRSERTGPEFAEAIKELHH